MSKYIIWTREVWTQAIEVEADDCKEAIKTAKLQMKEGNASYLEDTLEYSHNLSPGHWTIEKVEDE